MRLKALPLSSNGKVDHAALLAAEAIEEEADAPVVAPRDEWEHRLAALWRDLFKRSAIGIDDDFFDLGGHSLLALRLMTKVQVAFGISLSLPTLIERRTIRRLAALLSSGSGAGRYEPLVPIQPAGSGPRLFCIHPVGGSVFAFFELARCLGPDQPFYGLHAPDLLNTVPDKPIEEYAREYRQAIVAVDSEGPYFLAGYSFGGMVAFEVAQQLVAEGRRVAFLGLLDTRTPHEQGKIPDPDDAEMISILIRSQGRQGERDFDVPAAEIARHAPGEQFAFVFRQLKRTGMLDADIPDEMGATYLQNMLKGYKTRAHAARAYRPGIFPGRITLFRCQEIEPDARRVAERFGVDLRDQTYGWRSHAGQGVTVHDIPGSHERLCHMPAVRVLAARLGEALREATAS
jgi:thioesterase domain-containing protein